MFFCLLQQHRYVTAKNFPQTTPNVLCKTPESPVKPYLLKFDLGLMMWTKTEITQKWPAARIIGPDVTIAQATEYIWKTDQSFIDPDYAGNDHVFREKLQEWLQIEEPNNSREYWSDRIDLTESRGQINLEYFYSDWVACCYVGGPHGVVHPTGKVCLTKNFGKWPSIAAIEDELNIVASTFPWLEFDLGIWDGPDEFNTDTSMLADFAWKLNGGVWRRVDPSDIFIDKPCPQHPPFNFSLANFKEQYWSFEDLVKTFGPLMEINHAKQRPNLNE